MKTQRTPSIRRGFTLMELIVAMAITTIIVTVLVSITSMALDTWNRSRSELRASRQAKSMIDTMARDFESLVVRKSNTNEWLSAVVETTAEMAKIGDNIKSTNASKLVFFTAATDRYDGELNGADGIAGNSDDPAGDVSCVAYELKYRDPIGASGSVNTFVLNRLLVNPDDTFRDLLGMTDSTKPAQSLKSVFFTPTYQAKLSDPAKFICENIFQFSLTFHVQVTVPGVGVAPATVINIPVSVGQASSAQIAQSFVIHGNGIMANISGGAVTSAQLASGRITAVEISVTVLSDFGVEQQKKRVFTSTSGKTVDQVKAEFIAKHSYDYSKLVQLPTM